MFLSRAFGRALSAAARSEAYATSAASSPAVRTRPDASDSAARTQRDASDSAERTQRNPLEEFFEADRGVEEGKRIVYGRSWKASELRLKSWDDLHKLWYVLLKEKNMLMTQRNMLNAQKLQFPNPERLPKVRKSMCRLKHVLTERAIAEPDPRKAANMKKFINDL